FLVGLAGFAVSRFKRSPGKLKREEKLTLALIWGASVPLLFVTVFSPVFHWDSRSIWSFHAKLIYFEGSLARSGGWADPSISFWSHTDYPVLVPSLTAVLGWTLGVWNEYLMKWPCGLLIIGVALG